MPTAALRGFSIIAVIVAYDDYFLVGFKPFQHSLLSSLPKNVLVATELYRVVLYSAPLNSKLS